MPILEPAGAQQESSCFDGEEDEGMRVGQAGARRCEVEFVERTKGDRLRHAEFPRLIGLSTELLLLRCASN